MILGNIASVATLILFVFYFIGRIITIVRNRYVFTDELRMMGAGFDNKEFDIVEVFDLEKEAYNTFILTSRQGIYDLAVYRILYDSDFNQIGRKRLEKSTYSFLNIALGNTGSGLGPFGLGSTTAVLYSNYDASSIQRGDVVQLGRSANDIRHSVIVRTAGSWSVSGIPSNIAGNIHNIRGRVLYSRL